MLQGWEKEEEAAQGDQKGAASKMGGQPGEGGVLGASEGRQGSQEEERMDFVNSCWKVKLDEDWEMTIGTIG